MSDLIFNEIDEELRRERAQAFWKRHGIKIVIAAVIFAALIAGWRGYQASQANKMASNGDRLVSIIEQSEAAATETVVTDLDAFSKTSTKGTATLAKFRLASDHLRLGKPEEALKAFDALSAEGGIITPLRDMARLRAGMVALQLNQAQSVKTRIESLSSQDSSYRHSARELLGLAAYKSGDQAAAARWFEQLVTDQNVPTAARSRGQMMIALLAADGMSLEKARSGNNDMPTSTVEPTISPKSVDPKASTSPASQSLSVK